MKRWIFSIFVAMAMMVSIPASASAFEKMYSTYQPAYDTVVFTADTADPVNVAMATDGSEVDSTVPCMASCFKEGGSILASANFYQLKTDNRIPKQVLACDYESNVIHVSTKIPISKAV